MWKSAITSEELWEIVNCLHDEIMVFDNAYHLLFVNKAAERHYGISQEHLIGKSFQQLDEIYWGNSTLPEVYEKKTIVAKRQITNLGLDIITISVPVFDETGEIKFVVQNVNDIYNYLKEGKAEERFLNILDHTEPHQDEIIYGSSAMEHIMETLTQIKNVKNPCLILGETGTGKSLIAKHLHRISNRCKGPFVAVNCACMNSNLVESELFGYKKGAFSGANATGKKGIVELADGGVLFLDEISEIPYDLQGKLLWFIQEQEFLPLGSEQSKKVDVKVIAATNRDLRQMVHAGTFRADLYYRLNVFELTIPPLRERPEDIQLLAIHYLAEYNRTHLRSRTLSEDAMQVLLRYPWPGNVRELSHIIEKVVVLAQEKEIQTSDLPKDLFGLTNELPTTYYEGQTLPDALETLERKIVTDTYRREKSSVKTAKALGISQPTAYRLIKKYGLSL